MHGGINKAINVIPGQDDVKSEKWIDKLNEWKNSQLEEFGDDENDYEKACLNSQQRNASKLIELGVPGGNKGKTVI